MSGRLVASLSACLLLGSVSLVTASPRFVVFGIRQDPSDANARDFSRPGYGGGVEFSWPLANTQEFLAVHGGLEAVNLLSGKKVFYDPQTLLRIEQHTDQTYGRFYLGGQMGPHGGGTLRPYVNADLALVLYNMHQSVVIPDDVNEQNSLNQTLSDETKAAFGWSAGAGLNVSFGKWGIDGGARFVEQYGVPQQLGPGAVTIQPSYVQARLGLSFEVPIYGR